MPHIIVKLYPGRTEEQKISLAEQITKDVVTIAKCPEETVSVAIEEVEPERWNKEVYELYILNNESNLYKKSAKTSTK
ncbi:MAG: tautomerase family protein [Syntrophaceae bacterium]|jgi:4-oxalocrotonate tautomerase|nr:tautomerase family protein [Syntrophaceae bacterium]